MVGPNVKKNSVIDLCVALEKLDEIKVLRRRRHHSNFVSEIEICFIYVKFSLLVGLLNNIVTDSLLRGVMA